MATCQPRERVETKPPITGNALSSELDCIPELPPTKLLTLAVVGWVGGKSPLATHQHVVFSVMQQVIQTLVPADSDPGVYSLQNKVHGNGLRPESRRSPVSRSVLFAAHQARWWLVMGPRT